MMPLSRRHAPFYFIILSVFQKIPYCILVLMLGKGSLARVSLALGREVGVVACHKEAKAA
jgi:hypothetical protein